jgi:hypothetical protein
MNIYIHIYKLNKYAYYKEEQARLLELKNTEELKRKGEEMAKTRLAAAALKLKVEKVIRYILEHNVYICIYVCIYAFVYLFTYLHTHIYV